jgi:glyoxylase-like metal-dependent hydrolase (beta-lactamase superfamily II)
LIDRANGLLFTGDTYYPAPIWLFRPETNLDAYATSIRRLAALTPQVRLVLGAHNIPVASPTVLLRLVPAFDSVRAGKVSPIPESPGKVLYRVDDISFLMRAPILADLEKASGSLHSNNLFETLPSLDTQHLLAQRRWKEGFGSLGLRSGSFREG